MWCKTPKRTELIRNYFENFFGKINKLKKNIEHNSEMKTHIKQHFV